MDQICKYGRIHGRVSPLCNDWDLFVDLKSISRQYGIDFGLAVGITYAESHIGVNFNPQVCSISNNWSGKKGRKNEDGTMDWGWYDENLGYWRPFPDPDGCRVFKFDTVQEYWHSYSQSLKEGYIDSDCYTADCIVRRWVRGDGKREGKDSWVGRVNMFVK